MKKIALLLGLVFIVQGVVRADDIDDGRNAAAFYRQAFDRVPVVSLDAPIPASGSVLAPELTDYIAKCDSMFILVHKAAPLKRCDWAFRPYTTPGEMLDALKAIQRIREAELLRARQLFEQKTPGEANAALVDLLGLSRGLSQALNLLCRVTAVGLADDAIALSADHLNEISPDDRQALVNSMDSLNDLIQMGDVLVYEQRENLKYIRSESEQFMMQYATRVDAPKRLEEMIKEIDLYFSAAQDAMKKPVDQFSSAMDKAVGDSVAAKAFVTKLNRSVVGCRLLSARLEAIFQMERAAIAIANVGPDQLSSYRDPFGDGPFGYEDLGDGGYLLKSKLKVADSPVTLKVGPKPKTK